jgi:hypothetical protein
VIVAGEQRLVAHGETGMELWCHLPEWGGWRGEADQATPTALSTRVHIVTCIAAQSGQWERKDDCHRLTNGPRGIFSVGFK